MRRLAAGVFLLFGAGLMLPFLVFGAGSNPTTGTVCASATASTPAHVVGVDSSPVSTITGATATNQVCVTYTEPTVTVTTSAAPPPPPPPPPPAPPPPATLYVSPLGSDANPCVAASPCLSWNRAYRAASCGNAIEVAGGSYADQDVLDDPAKTACLANVVIRPATGASVNIGTKVGGEPPNVAGDHGLSLSGADHLTVSGPFTIRGEVEISRAVGSVVENVTALGGNLYVASPTQDVVVRASSFGGTNRYMSKVWLGPNGGQNVNLTFDGDRFHDVLSDDLNCCHVEGLLVIQENGLTIRNSTFTNNAVFDLSAGVCCGSALAGRITLENNHFNSARSGVSDYTVASINFNTNTSRFPPFTVRFNKLASGVSGTPPASGTYCGNTGSAPSSWLQPCP